MSSDYAKKGAAAKALDYVKSGMTVGLGTGSTAAHFVDLLGEKVRDGLQIEAIPTSEETKRQALAVGIEIIDPDETTNIQVAIDGTDEVDQRGTLIKGGGGALLREKIIAQCADQFIVIADSSKKVSMVGAFPLPVEIDQFSWALTVSAIRDVITRHDLDASKVALRSTVSGVFISDGKNFILDCPLGLIKDAKALDQDLHAIAGVMETGLFVDSADVIILGKEDGTTQTITSGP